MTGAATWPPPTDTVLTRPLPRSLDPLPGEGLDGFLLRLSYRLERSPYRIARLTGMMKPSGFAVMTFPHLMHLPPGRREQFARATRLSPGEVAGLCLSSLADWYPPASPTPQTRGWAGSVPPGNHWVFSRATRYCPQCLAGDGSAIQNDLGGPWHKTWRLPVVFACVKHTRFLEHLCPACARPIHDAVTARGASTEESSKMLPQTGRSDLHPTQCRLPLASDVIHTRDAPTCGAGLSGAPADPAAIRAEQEPVELQQRIDDLLDPSTPGDTISGGMPAAARQYFIDLRLITHLIRASWPRPQDLLAIPGAAREAISQDHRRGQQQHRDLRGIRRTTYDVPPLDARTCAALLITADRLLQCQQPRLLTEQLRHLLGYDTRSPGHATWTRQILVGKPDCSPGLRRALAPILQTNTPLPSGRVRKALQTPVRKTRYRPEHIAGFLQDDWYQRCFARMEGIRPRNLRRAAAIHLCQIAVGGPVTDAARLVGMPATHARQSVDAVYRWARSRPDPGEFETALHQLADELDSAPHLIDYQRRRDALNHWCIDPATWQQLTNGLEHNHHGQMALGDHKRQAASIFVWTRVTQSEHLLAPRPIFDQQPPEVRTAWRPTLGNICRGFLAGRGGPDALRLKDRLDEYADTLAASIDRGEYAC
jgi:hypothetical protein